MRDREILNFCISFVLGAGDIRSGSHKVGIWVGHIGGISVVFVSFSLSLGVIRGLKCRVLRCFLLVPFIVVLFVVWQVWGEVVWFLKTLGHTRGLEEPRKGRHKK